MLKTLISISKISTCACMLALPFSANANFYVDYQGMDHNTRTKHADASRLRGAPDGYRVLTDNSYGVVHEIGSGKADLTDSFGSDMALKDAVAMIMPESWIAYIDEGIEKPTTVNWQGSKEPWTNLLGKIGSNYGYHFVVDWDQKLIQISADEGFQEPDYNDPIALKDAESGRTIFVYSAKPVNEGGVILVDGEVVPVSIVE